MILRLLRRLLGIRSPSQEVANAIDRGWRDGWAQGDAEAGQWLAAEEARLGRPPTWAEHLDHLVTIAERDPEGWARIERAARWWRAFDDGETGQDEWSEE